MNLIMVKCVGKGSHGMDQGHVTGYSLERKPTCQIRPIMRDCAFLLKNLFSIFFYPSNRVQKCD